MNSLLWRSRMQQIVLKQLLAKGGLGLFIRVLQASTHCSESVENSML